MPGFDGTGPLGQGPMTGGGRGFCVLPYSALNQDNSQNNANTPVANASQGFIYPAGIRPFGMCRGGMGRRTGRGRGRGR